MLTGTYERARQDLRDNGSSDGDALLVAFFDMHTWFTRTTGLKHTERLAALMTPKPVKSDEDLADAVEA